MCGRVAKLLRKFARLTHPPRYDKGSWRRRTYQEFNEHRLTLAHVKRFLAALEAK